MSPRRRSGATRRAKKAAAGANNEQATASREVSTQQGTTVCEDEEAPAFGEVNEDSKGEKTQEQPEDVQAQDPAEGEQQRKEEEETDGSDKSAGQHVEGEDETDGFADEEQVSPEDINGKAEEEGESQERRKEVHKTNEMPVEAAAEAGREEEKAEQEVHTKEEEMKGQQEKGAGEEEKPTETEKKKEQEEVTEQWQEGQLKYEEQAKEHQEDALHQPAEAKEEEEADDDQQENEGTVAEERQGGPRLQHSGSFIEWTGSDAEFSVTPSAESMGLCCTRDARGSICEELFVTGDGPYGPEGRRRVFNEAKGILVNRIPSATARYLEEAHEEGIGDACLSCSSDVLSNCFPAAKLFVETMVASGAAFMSLLYQYRNEILQGVACLTASTFRCIRTCVCTITPPPQEPRKLERTPPSPWTSIGESTEIWAPLGSLQISPMQSQHLSESVYADVQPTSLSPRTSVGPLEQGSHTRQSRYRPIIAPGTNQTIFSRRISSNH